METAATALFPLVFREKPVCYSTKIEQIEICGRRIENISGIEKNIGNRVS